MKALVCVPKEVSGKTPFSKLVEQTRIRHPRMDAQLMELKIPFRVDPFRISLQEGVIQIQITVIF
jgi:hypothetical protein